jgi:hypothetical protein
MKLLTQEVLATVLDRLSRQRPVDCARICIGAALQALNRSRTSDEREQVAAELARVDHGGAARLELADMAARDLAAAKGES